VKHRGDAGLVVMLACSASGPISAQGISDAIAPITENNTQFPMGRHYQVEDPVVGLRWSRQGAIPVHCEDTWRHVRSLIKRLLLVAICLPPVFMSGTAYADDWKMACPDGAKANDPEACPPSLSVASSSGSPVGVQPFQEYSKRIESSQRLAPLQFGLFGDQVSLYNGY
jgi:hypothetical protein